MDRNKKKPLSISKTKAEWEVINKKIIASDQKTLNGYLRSQISKLKRKHEEFPGFIITSDVARIQKRPYVDISIHEDLKLISVKMKIPVSTVIDRFIIAPLLLPD